MAVSASKARAFTRKRVKSEPSVLRLIFKFGLLIFTVFLSWFLVSIRPPPFKLCGTTGGPPVTAPRIKLRDGRYLAYKEGGVPKEEAKHHIIVAHAFTRSRHDLFPASQETIQRLGLHIVGYDRAGYGQSDPNPSRNVKSEAEDIQELADHLELGSKFYLVSHSIGAHAAYGLMKYFPHRLAGVAMVVPVVNFWWPSLSTPEGKAVFNKLPIGDRLFLSVAHYVPSLTYWWMTQKVLPTSTTMNPQQQHMCPSDWASRMQVRKNSNPEITAEALQQGVMETICRDSIVMFGKWGFDPTELKNPAGEDEDRKIVHVWQGVEDFLVPTEHQRMVMKKIPWVDYREVPGKGHYLMTIPGFADEVAETLVKSS